MLTSLLILALSPPGPSFRNEVLPVFTRAGCNSGGCHGKLAGQSGFRLSLRGYAPEQDYQSLVREFAGRRVNIADADNSLLLQKATGRALHGGGKVLDAASPEYATLKAWIAAGATGVDALDPKLVRVTMTPGRVLKLGEQAELTITATWSDGRTTDVTRLARVETNDADVLDVGHVSNVPFLKTLRSGSGTVRAAFLSEVAAATYTVPFPRRGTTETVAANFIDTHVNRKLADLNLPTAPLCDDATFLRRSTLDTIGKLPTPNEVRTFLADTSADKRSKWIEALLKRPEFDDTWSLFLSDLVQNRKERDHDVRGTAGVREFHGWLKQQLTARRGWDAIAKDILLVRGKVSENPAVGFYLVTVGEHREVEKSEAAESVAQIFLGSRIGCARCHNHPLERTTQDDFYAFSAGFTRIKLDRGDAKKKREAALDVEAVKPPQARQPRTSAMLPPRTLDRQLLPKAEDPRQPLAEWIVNQPGFRVAMVNRLWKHFLREGLVEPVDDLRETNPPTNPELLAALGDDFATHGFDLRHTMRMILNSRTYQRSSDDHGLNETKFYSHAYARRLPAEVLLDAVSDATGVPEKFTGYPLGWRAIQVSNPTDASPFLKTFGSSERTTACACERSGDVTLPQLLAMLNGERITLRLDHPQGALRQLLAEKNDAKVLDALFLRTFSRLPTKSEAEAVKLALKDANRDEVFRDVFWALLNSKEFLFSH